METVDKRFISLRQAERLTKGNYTGFKAYWQNYDLYIWKPDAAGYMRASGKTLDGVWGTVERSVINERGFYSVSARYARVVGGGPRDTSPH
jgi:hypothetical protein